MMIVSDASTGMVTAVGVSVASRLENHDRDGQLDDGRLNVSESDGKADSDSEVALGKSLLQLVEGSEVSQLEKSNDEKLKELSPPSVEVCSDSGVGKTESEMVYVV